MESNSESPIIIQMLKNVKQIIEVSKERSCWKEGELKNINITYHNVCEIARQLEERDTRQLEERDKKVDEPVEEMDEVD